MLMESMTQHLEQGVETRTRELALTTTRLEEVRANRWSVPGKRALVHRANGGIEAANPAVLEILGLDIHQLRGPNAIDPHLGLTTPE